MQDLSVLSHSMDWPAFSCVACLRLRISPSAVIRTISLIVIYSIDTKIMSVVFMPSASNRPLIKWKKLFPFVTYAYPSTLIVFVTIASRYNTAP